MKHNETSQAQVEHFEWFDFQLVQEQIEVAGDYDGTLIGFSGGLNLINLATGQRTHVGYKANHRAIHWDAAHQYLYFADSDAIYQVDLHGQRGRQLLPRPSEMSRHFPTARNPVFSPDYRHLIYRSGYFDRETRERVESLFLVDLETMEERQIYVDNAQSETAGFLRWSPDGRWLIFEDTIHIKYINNKSESGHIFLVDAACLEDGHCMAQEIIDTREAAYSSGLSWDMSSQFITFDGYYLADDGRYNGRETFIYELATGRTTQLTLDYNMAMYPTFSPDSQKIAFSGTVHYEGQRSRNQVHVMNLDGSDVERIIDLSIGDLLWVETIDVTPLERSE